MKHMRKSTRYILAAALAYLLLLWLLVAVERAGGDALIDTLPKALWFSLATLTTVGYGDLYPVTAAGRLIGIVFMLFSTGLLALLIGLGYAYVKNFYKAGSKILLTYYFGTDGKPIRCAEGYALSS